MAITGCMGRMGQQLIKSAKKIKFYFSYKIKVNKRIFGIKPKLNSTHTFKDADIIIDFTVQMY